MVVDVKLCQTPIPKPERTETLENLIVLIGENYGTNPSWHLSVELEPARVFPENFDMKLLRDSAENSNFTIEGCGFPAAIAFGTSKTLHTHLKAILWDELPKTFQNAVIICRRLKIYYLWIDALCILQECPGLTAAQVTETKKDFARENTAMANIYQNSYLTISADISTSMNSGIFSFSSNKYHAIQVVDDNSNNVTLYGQSTDLEHGRKPTTLEERGWNFQESSLPHRVLYYGESDITWRYNIKHSREAFSRRTRVTSQNLENFLAWFYGPYRGHRSTQYRAPSWSWASIETSPETSCGHWPLGEREYHPIFPHCTQQTACTIYNATCELETSDPTGRVRNGYIELGVSLEIAKIVHSRGVRNWDYPWSVKTTREEIEPQICCLDCELKDDNITLGDEIYCAPILEALRTNCSERGCLMIKHLEGQQYRRVGFCVLVK
ncbi:hypothetical protein BofuT4_P037420.1 [Botrytis cinerea T4]|uniref:Heterokaryon incompatibility domain-containing protein n=1 Tax=Botryotinia fuckeliana (strain T4) TaxID=999810 RepID=G2Y522_BOTF4|nr:hypothetical protein BofuT4_P037420.1 [Botrytis cinerea T4]